MLNRLDKEDVIYFSDEFEVVGDKITGGQKIVFPCKYKDEKYALKILKIPSVEDGDDENSSSNHRDEIIARVEREVELMRSLDSSHIVKFGPYDISQKKYKNEDYLFYLEEWIVGPTIDEMINSREKQDIRTVVDIGIDVTKAIKELWAKSIIHRDIKPKNIMFNSETMQFILLDYGIAFDLDDESLTSFGFIPCTAKYVAPEQLELGRKRQLDFRADLFCLGIVLFEACYGIHPFYQQGMSNPDIFTAIRNNEPFKIVIAENKVDKMLNQVINDDICSTWLR